MADSNFSCYRDEPIDARHQAERNKTSKPSKPDSNHTFSPKGWPLESRAGFQALMQLGQQNPNHSSAWPSLDYLFEENARLQSDIRSSQIRSSEQRASDKAKRDAMRAQLERVKKMEISKRPVSTKAEETGQEKRTSASSVLPTDPHARSRSQDGTAPIPEHESQQGQTSDDITRSLGHRNKSHPTPPGLSGNDHSPPHDRDEAQVTTTSPENIAAVAKSPKFKDDTSQAQSGNACAGQAKKRLSGHSLKRVLKGATKKIGLRRDASR
ncbi:uncharacterized protein J4E88_007158 [Alternaria novae-zelandiae]|uniref:uncharacterized protein n=1 Tax=Alternaria novae-zelandiae TaxID=430562 RepID=UPI0020C38A91|nr:uncharacterized protein J4E88_007158 [Alternaria novae-zelandiae]KAI4677350.1 hypothetical protein J4E88_007158 [Alternaria novae-zelandiae]